MRPGFDEGPKRCFCRTLALLVSAAALAGCSSDSLTGSSDGSFGSRFTGFFSGATPGVTQPASRTASAPEIDCPGVDIRAGTSTLNIAAKAAKKYRNALRELAK